MEARFIEERCLYDFTGHSDIADKVNKIKQLGCKNVRVLSTKSFSESTTELADKLRSSRWEFECSPEQAEKVAKSLGIKAIYKADNEYVILITELVSDKNPRHRTIQSKESKSESLIQPMPQQDQAEEKQTAEILKLIKDLRSEIASKFCMNKSRKQKSCIF